MYCKGPEYVLYEFQLVGFQGIKFMVMKHDSWKLSDLHSALMSSSFAAEAQDATTL